MTTSRPDSTEERAVQERENGSIRPKWAGEHHIMLGTDGRPHLDLTLTIDQSR
jgi:hypothetical protein